jgi:hypothetical protein
MTVWVLTEYTKYEGETVVGVTADLDKAEQWVAAVPDQQTCADQNLAHEFTLDGEKVRTLEGPLIDHPSPASVRFEI